MSDRKPPDAAAEMDGLLEALASDRAATLDAARPAAVAKQHKRAGMTARERIAHLVDPGSFREFGQLAHEADASPGERPADGIVTGGAMIEGRPAVVLAQDFMTMGGSSGELGGKKLHMAVRRSIREGAPLVMLLDGGGHRIQIGQSSRRYAPSTTTFQEFARLSGWAPMAAAMLGAGFAAPTNFAGLADFISMVRGQSTMGLAGPALVKAGTGEDVDKFELGGAQAQVDRNGIADLGVEDEAAALDSLKRFLSYLPSNARAPMPITAAPAEDRSRAEALRGLVPANTRKAYDVRRVDRPGDGRGLGLRGEADLCQERGDLAGAAGRPARGGHREPGDEPRRHAHRPGLRQGRPFRGALRRLRPAAGLFHRRARLLHRLAGGEGAAGPALRQADLRAGACHRSAGLGGPAQGLRAGLRRHGRRAQLRGGRLARLAHRRDLRDVHRGRRRRRQRPPASPR